MATVAFALNIFILAWTTRLTIQQRCSSSSDVGQTECVLLDPHYSTRQWATCLTEDYIIRVSNGDHYCRGRVSECWYQCMLEIYGIDEGPVYNDCSCSTAEVPPNNVSRLEPHCYSPQGDDCEWYVNCLERRYPCRGTGDGYAIEYAYKFCNLFFDNYNDFSLIGRNWVDAVRRCLQVELVPTLRLWVSYTCADIRRIAFNSHPGCYTNVNPSMCELGFADVWQAFVVVNFPNRDITEGALVQDFISTSTQMLSVIRRCSSSHERGFINNLVTSVILTVTVGTVTGNPLAAVAFGVANYFARELQWQQNGFRWFPLLDDDDNSGNRKRQITDETINIRVLLVDTKLLNISNGTMLQSSSEQTLDQAVDNLVDAVMNGSLSAIPLNINNIEVISSLSLVRQCTDINCTSTNITEIATAPTEAVPTPTEPVATPTESLITASTQASPITPTGAGGGAKILHFHCLALFVSFATILLLN